MKKILIVVFATLLNSLPLFASGEGINYFEGSFSEAKSVAAKENKFIVVDCYTSWCGPCKHMTESVFTTKLCGDFFNDNYLFIKIDMEKGEGVDLGKKFGIRAYPTFIIINPQGDEEHRFVGGGTAENFIERVKLGVNPESSLRGMTKMYDKGERSVKFMERYINAQMGAKSDFDDTDKLFEQYYASLSDDVKQSAEAWWLFSTKRYCSFNGDRYNYLICNRDGFVRNVGAETYNKQITEVAFDELTTYITGRAKTNRADDFRNTIEKVESLKLKSDLCDLFCKLGKITLIEDFKSYEKRIQRFFTKVPKEHLYTVYDIYASNYLNNVERLELSKRIGESLLTKLSTENVEKVKQSLTMKNKLIEVMSKSVKQ